MHKTSEALQWRQMMLNTLRDAQHHLAVAEGNASVKVMGPGLLFSVLCLVTVLHAIITKTYANGSVG